MKKILIRTALLAFMTLTAGLLPAQVPQLISYQGRVGVDGVNFDGSGQFKFAFVNAAGTTTYWSNDGSSTAGSEPGTAISIPVSKGLYAVLLGDATLDHMSIVPATVFTHGDVHLRVWFSDGVNGFQQLTPDRRIAAVGYAMMADSVSDGAITTAKIADGAVTSAKLAAGVVQTANLATGAVGNAQLANSAVTINAGTGLGGGGLVSLGGAVSLSNAGVLSLTGGGGITVDAATGAITLGSSATSAGTAGAIVARDAGGGFTAGTITGTLNGNAATATTATDFTGMLAGDVTGTQAATAIAATTVTGKALTGFTSAAGSVTASDTLLSAISKLDGNTALKAPLASPTFTGSVTLPAGSATAAPLLLQTGTSLTTPTFGALEFDGTNLFVTNNSASPTRKTVAFTDSTVTTAQIEAGSVTTAKLATGAVGSAQLASGLTLGGTTTGTFSGSLTGNVTGNVSGSAASFTGSLAGDVTSTQAATVVSTVGGLSAANIAAGATLANTATSANTASTLVTRDASGNFSAGIITGALNGNAATATTASSATSFTGGLTGDVTGTQSATVVSSLGGLSAASIASGAALANNATAANTAGTLVKRDASGNFTAGTITGSLDGNAATATNATSFTGMLAGDVTGTQGATVVSTVGTSTAATVHTAELAANAATSANTPGTIMKRDANGDFSAGTVTASTFMGKGALPWVVVSGTSQQAEPNTGYVAANPAEVTITLPTSPAIGDIVRVSGVGAGGWKISQNAGQQIDSSIISPVGTSWSPKDEARSWSCVASSSDGSKLLAGVIYGKLYVSIDGGLTWTARESDRYWSGVTMSADGGVMAAVAQDEQIYTSNNLGVTWTARSSARSWKCIASTTDGTILYAADNQGYVYRTTNSGVTWTVIRTGAGSGYGITHIACSANGVYVMAVGSVPLWSSDSGASFFVPSGTASSRIAMTAGGRAYVSGGSATYSVNGGSFFQIADFNVGDLACSSDGTKILGGTHYSYDSGRTWVRHMCPTSRPAVSADFRRLVMVGNGQPIQTSSVETSLGTGGFIRGSTSTAVELQHIGNGRFLPLSSTGTIYSN